MILSLLTVGSCVIFGFKGFTNMPVLLDPVSVSCSTIPHAEVTWKLGEALLLTKKEVNHFQIYTNNTVVFMIF